MVYSTSSPPTPVKIFSHVEFNEIFAAAAQRGRISLLLFLHISNHERRRTNPIRLAHCSGGGGGGGGAHGNNPERRKQSGDVSGDLIGRRLDLTMTEEEA